MGKHTPAPWKVGMGGSIRCDYTDKDGDDIIIGGIRNRSIQIGSAPFTTPKPSEQEANATLISAAPELLDALQNILNGIEAWMIDSPADDLLENAAKRARNAIKKARGES